MCKRSTRTIPEACTRRRVSCSSSNGTSAPTRPPAPGAAFSSTRPPPSTPAGSEGYAPVALFLRVDSALLPSRQAHGLTTEVALGRRGGGSHLRRFQRLG